MVEICDMRGIDQAYWLADKIPAYGDYAKEAANVLRRQAHELERLLAAQEELLGEVARLRTQRDDILAAARRTLDENGHLADGEICTLIVLKRAVETLGECKDRARKRAGRT